MVDLTGYKLTFDDEFNSLSVSQTGEGTTWKDIRPESRLNASADIGFGDSAFVDSSSGINPFSIENGALNIQAVQAPSSIVGPGQWASGLISSQSSFAQTYGYFEMRAEFPQETGVWPAFWLLPENGAVGTELDVVEAYGSKDLYQTIHSTDYAQSGYWSYYSPQPAITSGYHTYGVLWTQATITFYLDGKAIVQEATPSTMDVPMYMLADLAMQAKAGVSSNPKNMQIDYIRAYSNEASAVIVPLQTVSSPDGNSSVNLYNAVTATVNHYDVASLYYALLDRAPDPSGLTTWEQAVNNGTSLTQVAQAFLASPEYENSAVGQNNAKFIDSMYATALDRTSDAGGLQTWLTNLDSGILSRADVVNGFLSSSEFQADQAMQSNSAYISKVYEVALGRDPDAGGLQTWLTAMMNGMSRNTFDQAIVGSSEFHSVVSTVAQSAFVNALYEGALGRPSDTGGLQNWDNALSSGSPLSSVAVGITGSAEANAHLAPKIQLAGF